MPCNQQRWRNSNFEKSGRNCVHRKDHGNQKAFGSCVLYDILYSPWRRGGVLPCGGVPTQQSGHSVGGSKPLVEISRSEIRWFAFVGNVLACSELDFSDCEFGPLYATGMADTRILVEIKWQLKVILEAVQRKVLLWQRWPLCVPLSETMASFISYVYVEKLQRL